MTKWVWLLCAGGLALPAQTLQVSSRSVSPGDRASIVIALHSEKASGILGLQWDTTFPTRQVSVEGDGPVVSDAGKMAGKSLTCAGKAAKEPEHYSYTCILIGGQKEIAAGPIAIFHFRISAKAQSGDVPVR